MATKKTTDKRTATKKTVTKPVEELKEQPVVTALPDKDAETVVDGEVIGADVLEEVQEKNDTVVVASNWPRNIIFEVMDDTGHMRSVLIRGNGTHLKGLPSGILSVGAYGVTTNVPKELWEKIAAQHKDDPRFKDGLIFASTQKKVRREATERKDLRNGFEPVDTSKKRDTEPLSD
ncbi:MAG: hypothetical protein J5915_02015 [Acidaminococcaceae bacterium]|nr:hypothetical protein [Acidaminococcaceae bacterium]